MKWYSECKIWMGLCGLWYWVIITPWKFHEMEKGNTLKKTLCHTDMSYSSLSTVFQLLLLYHIVSLLLHGGKPSSNKNPLTYQYTVLQHTQNSLWIATLLSLQKQTDYIYKLNFSLQSPSYWWPMVKILS